MDIGELTGKSDEILGREICNGQDTIRGGMAMFSKTFCYRNAKKLIQDGLLGLSRPGVTISPVKLYSVVMTSLSVDVRL